MKTKLMTAVGFLFVLALLAPQRAQAQRKHEGQKHIPVALPDLIVLKAVLVNSDTGRFDITVLNKGAVAASPAHIQLNVFDINGKPYKFVGTEQPAVKAGEKIVLSLSIDLPVSSMRYEVVTDMSREVDESNEQNNIYKGYVGKN